MNSKENLDYIEAVVRKAFESMHFDRNEDYENRMNSFLDSVVPCLPAPGIVPLTDEEKLYIFNRIQTSISFGLEESVSWVEEAVLDDKWLENSDVQFDYAKRYFRYLDANKHWQEESIEDLEKLSFDVIQMLGDPSSTGTLHRKGLLIGDVQSGKTANYTAILNRAIDVGYNVVILLAGTTSVLRTQTQRRIDCELVGKTEEQRSRIVGVGEIADLNRILTATSALFDYSKKTSRTQAALIQNGRTLLFVTKKNVSTLQSIADALEKSNTAIRKGVDGRLDASLLLVDDEADNASVDTSKPDRDPTAINRCIRRLLHMFARTGYLAVTATPFANIFIDDDLKSEFGDDIFPSDFISLASRPYEYVGAREFFGDVDVLNWKRKFGREISYADLCIREIPDSDMATTYTFKHKATLRVDSYDDLPASMKYAIRYFIIVQQLMDFLPGVETHRTMLVNVSRYVKVQENLFLRISEWLSDALAPQVRKYANRPQTADDVNTGEYHELKLIWDQEKLETMSGMTWDEFSPHLAKSVAQIRVAVVNNGTISKSGNGLDYDAHPNGDRVIAVGGQCLSRGLTLEGLVVSYFYRNSAAYDTLLQMGRWFGYRNAYIQYFRIWLSETSNEWYQLISDACEDLRSQVAMMKSQGMSPSQFGLAVRLHPCSGLVVTAANKMRGTVQSDRRIVTDLSGKLIESPRLYYDKGVNARNARHVEDFMEELAGTRSLIPGKGGFYWKEVDRDRIADFVRGFSSAKLNLGFRVSDLDNYIRKGSTEKWDVAIAQSGKTSTHPVRFTIAGVNRTFADIGRSFDIVSGDVDVMRVSGHNVRIGTGPVTRLGLSDEDERKLAEEYDSATWEKGRNSASIYLRNRGEFKRNSILILYPLTLHDKNNAHADYGQLVWGIGLGFAGDHVVTSGSECFSYVLNPVAQMTEWDFTQEEDDDVDEE